MKKRPLGTLCLIVTGFIFLVTKFFPGEKESLSFSEEEICITGTVYQKELSAAEEKPVLYIKDICFEGAEGQEEITSIQAVCYLRETSKDAGIGSRITIKGCPWEFEEATNPGQFDRKFYYSLIEISFGLSNAYVLAESGEYHPVKENLFKLRSFCVKKLEECLREEEAGVLKAVLLGTKASVEAELKALYQRNGIAHILAISGLHISMLGMGAYHLLRKPGASMGIAAGTAAALMICYGIMTGFSVSVLRAVIMFLINMLAKMVGRTYDMLTALGVAAVLVLLEQPMYLYYGGFVFSFGCVLGIGVCMPALTEGKNPLSAWKKRVLSGGAIAVISYPMYLWFYYQFPPYSVILNLFVVPLMSFLMIGGILIIVLQCFVPRLVFIPVLLIRGILKIYEFSCNACEKLPGHMFTPGKPGLWQLCFYLGILLLFVVLHKQKKKRPSLKIKWLGVLVGVIVLSLRPGNYLEITFLDVGQGDCIYVKSREGNHYLIDGGSTSVSEVGKYRILPFLKYKGAGEVEAVIVTHPDADHINGVLELLACGRAEGIRIKALVLPQIEEKLKNTAYRELEAVAGENGVKVFYIRAGERITDKELLFTCLNPKEKVSYGEPNEYSVVLELAEKEFRVLLTGDVQGIGETTLLEEYLRQGKSDEITVLKAAHHGSKHATSKELLSVLKPRLTVISCGKNNAYHHPHEETLHRLKEAGSTVLSTHECGAIMIKKEKQIQIYGWHQPQNLK